MSRNKNRLRKHQHFIGIAIIFLLIGFLLGAAIDSYHDLHFQFDDKIELEDIASILCTVILAWIITAILDKENQAEATSKKLILRRVEELYLFISDTAIKSSSDGFLYTDATSATKRINITVDNVYKQLTRQQLAADDEIKTNIFDDVQKLGDLLTNTPVHDAKDGKEPAAKVIEGKLYFNTERKLEIENAFEKLKNDMVSLELAINSS